jgi:ribonuclease E
MGVILRTAGATRTKAEVKRDFEYLLRLWEQVRDLTLKSTAPTLVYEEGSLAKRSIRDLYTKDIDEVIVAGESGYNDAKEFMRMLMPTHARNVKLYRDTQPIFTRYGIESQLDAMFSPTVQLRSGGYIVLNQTEALVSIDVNSGRSTREHHIEDTALKTNVEAAEEIAPASRSAASRTSVCWKCRASASVPRCWKARPRNACIAAAPATCARCHRCRSSCCAHSRRRCSRVRPTI